MILSATTTYFLKGPSVGSRSDDDDEEGNNIKKNKNKTSNKGYPTISNWVQNKDGSVQVRK